MILTTSILAAAPGQQPSVLPNLLMMGVIFGIFYLLVFAPMRKKQKQHAAMIAEVKNGDRVVTTGGIHATVVGVGEDVLQLRIADQVKIEVSKNAISAFLDRKE